MSLKTIGTCYMVALCGLLAPQVSSFISSLPENLIPCIILGPLSPYAIRILKLCALDMPITLLEILICLCGSTPRLKTPSPASRNSLPSYAPHISSFGTSLSSYAARNLPNSHARSTCTSLIPAKTYPTDHPYAK